MESLIEPLITLLHIVFLLAVLFVGFFMQCNLVYDDYKYWPPGLYGILLVTAIQLALLIITTRIVWFILWE